MFFIVCSSNYSPYFAHEYGGFSLPEAVAAAGGLTHLNDQRQMARDRYDEDYEDEGVKRYSALDAWNGSVEADTENELSVVRLGDDCIKREFLINHGQFGALLGPHGIRIAQIRSQCRTVRIHTVAGSSINTCSVQVMGPRVDVSHAVNLIMQSIKEHDRKFPFKHHRFSGRLR